MEAAREGGPAQAPPRPAPPRPSSPLSLSDTRFLGPGLNPLSSNHAPWLRSREICDLHRKTRLLCRKRPMGEGDGCGGWVLKEPMSAPSGEFKKRRSAPLKPVRDWNLLGVKVRGGRGSRVGRGCGGGGRE